MRKMTASLAVLAVTALACGRDGGNAIPSPRPVTETFEIDPGEAQALLASTGVGVSFGADSLVTASGDAPEAPVSVSLSCYLCAEDLLLTDMPGSFEGALSDGSSAALASLGVIGVEISDASGSACNLAEGATATLTVPALTSGPESVPLWHLDEQASVWDEEGAATLSGSSYEAEVTHFSKWNVDIACNSACVVGRVVEGSGDPVPAAYVDAAVSSTSCFGWSAGMLAGGFGLTGGDGGFQLDWLPGDATATLRVVDGDRRADVTITIPPEGDDCIDVGDIVLSEAPDTGTGGDCFETLTTGIWGWKGDQDDQDEEDWYYKDLVFYTDYNFRFFSRRYDPGYDNGYDGVYNDSVTSGTWTEDGCSGTLSGTSGEADYTLSGNVLRVGDLDYQHYSDPQTPTGAYTDGLFP